MIKLFHSHQSRSMRVLWLLHELGLEFELIIQAFDKSLRSKEYLNIHPVGRVPALSFDGQIIWESGAITQVLCERFPQGGMGCAPDHPERAQWLIWLHFSETISQHCAALTQQHIVLYRDEMRSPTIMSLEPRRLEKCYLALESRLSVRDYLLDGGFSAADISVGQAVYIARHFARIDGFSGVTAWYERLISRPAFQASLPPDGATVLWSKEFYEPPNV